MRRMKTRLVIITEIIAPYRIPVFNALARHPEIDARIIFLSETDLSLREWKVRKTEIHFSYEVLPCFRRRVGRYNVLINRGISTALRKVSPDVLLCGGYSYAACWQAAGWARRRNVPVLLWVESTGQDRRRNLGPVERLKKRFIEGADGFVVPGSSAAAYLKSFGIPDRMVFCAPNAVDNEFFASQSAFVGSTSQADHLPDRFFLYVGRLVPEKGVFDLLAAYRKLTPALRKDCGLVFAGGGVSRAALEKLARIVSPGTVVFTGFVEQEELAALYARAEALVFPTHSDPWGLVVNEAMACGLPIIATSVAGCVADLVEDRWNGWVVASRDVEALCAALQSLAMDQALRRRMGINSQERIRRYSPEACAQGLARAAMALEGVRG
jgi:glycosyltransferase involved in cell wall biosynthesis